MKVKTLFRHRKGLNPLSHADLNSRTGEIGFEADVSYAVLPPPHSIEQILKDLQRAAEDDADTFVMVCTNLEETQEKLFRKTPAEMGFDSELHAPPGILGRIRERIEGISDREKPSH